MAEDEHSKPNVGADGKIDSSLYDATHTPDSYIKQHHVAKDYGEKTRPAEQNPEDPMAKYRKWGYESWPPEHDGLPFILQPDVDSPNYRGRQWAYKLFDDPVVWARDRLLKWRESQPGWKRPVYYHRRYVRVPDIDQCDENDMVCVFEADNQFMRDKKVEGAIIQILRGRVEHCWTYEKQDWARKCKKLTDDFMDANTNYKIKYAEFGISHNVISAYMKQKHRMIFERRNPDKVDIIYGKRYTENRFYGPDVIKYDEEYPMPK